jgi:hypothetical protein
MESTMSLHAAFLPPSTARWLRLEGAVTFIGALFAYQLIGGNWWIFGLLLLSPDLSMASYLAGKSVGSRVYNLVHSYVAPTLLAVLGLGAGQPLLVQFALIWFAHISGDRALGYGLKYPGVFEATHLGPIGRAKRTAADAHAT